MYLLQFEPRSASELPPVLTNRFLVRCATWAMVRHEADEISPTMQATLSRSIMRSALVEAVCGLTESSLMSSILRPMHAAGGVDLLDREVDRLHGVLAERAEEAGARRQVADADGFRLSIADRGKAGDRGHGGCRARCLDQ